jgi:hypothetical protein
MPKLEVKNMKDVAKGAVTLSSGNTKAMDTLISLPGVVAEEEGNSRVCLKGRKRHHGFTDHPAHEEALSRQINIFLQEAALRAK